MTQNIRHVVVMTLIIIVGTLALGCTHRQGNRSRVIVIEDASAVADVVNAHVDRMRVVELVSPTCPPCLHGARSVNERVVKPHGEEVVTIVVWIPMLKTDSVEAARMYSGTEAHQFYDRDLAVGWAYARGPFEGASAIALDALPDDHWLKLDPENYNEQPVWDAYFAYAPGVRWEDEPPMPTRWVRHIGMDKSGLSYFWHDDVSVPPTHGDLADAIEAMLTSVQPDAGSDSASHPGVRTQPPR